MFCDIHQHDPDLEPVKNSPDLWRDLPYNGQEQNRSSGLLNLLARQNLGVLDCLLDHSQPSPRMIRVELGHVREVSNSHLHLAYGVLPLKLLDSTDYPCLVSYFDSSELTLFSKSSRQMS